MNTPSPDYLETLTRYYEEEVEGEAYFYAIAERLSDPDERQKMRMVAEVETYAAAAVAPLLDKYGLSPQSAEALRASGRRMAAEQPGDFNHFLQKWRKEFPGYIDEFEALEAMAPPEDVPVLKILTDHEHAAIAFLEKEAAGEPDSTAPMRRYLETGRA